MERRRILVSACLLGRACRYDGGHKHRPSLLQSIEQADTQIVPVCPEQLGGLSTPRPPADLRGGDGASVLRGDATVQTVDVDEDVTKSFVDGARAALAKAPDAAEAWLMARSPSCGVGTTYVDGELRDGDGVFAALLRREGIPCTAVD